MKHQDAYRNALMWTFDRLNIDGGMTPAQQLKTMLEIGKVLSGSSSVAARYVPSDWDDSTRLGLFSFVCPECGGSTYCGSCWECKGTGKVDVAA